MKCVSCLLSDNTREVSSKVLLHPGGLVLVFRGVWMRGHISNLCEQPLCWFNFTICPPHCNHQAVVALSVPSSHFLGYLWHRWWQTWTVRGWTLEEKCFKQGQVPDLILNSPIPAAEAQQQKSWGCALPRPGLTQTLCCSLGKWSMNSSSGLCIWLSSSARDEAIN